MRFDPSKSLTDAEIRERINAVGAGQETTESSGKVLSPSPLEAPPAPTAEPYRFADPITSATQPLLDVLQHDDETFEFGILDVDVYLRGLRAKEACVITAFPHSGKTSLLLTAICNNPEKRILFLSLDDPREMILQKLVCMTHQLRGTEFEAAVRDNDQDMVDLLRSTPTDRFPNLLVSDASMGVEDLPVAVGEATDFWGAAPQAVMLDYVGLLGGKGGSVEDGFSSVSTRMKELKAFAKSLPCPLLIVHQGTRGGAKPGTRITMTSMAFGGEQEATMVLGLRRKRDDEERDATERHRLRNTVTVDIPKLKRIGGRLTGPEGIDLFLDPNNGIIRTLHNSDFDEIV
jgi:replicative DNA helicase